MMTTEPTHDRAPTAVRSVRGAYERDDDAGAGACDCDGRPLITFGRRAEIVAARGDGRVGTILMGRDG